MMRNVFILFLSCLMVFGMVSEVYAQSSRDLNNRLNRVEKELQTLNRAVYKGDTPPPPSFSAGGGDPAAAADAQIRLQQLEIELRDIRGLIEQQDNDIRQMKNQLERSLSDMELRLGQIESGGAQNAVPYTASGATQGAGSTQGQVPAVNTGGADDFSWSSNGGENQAPENGSLGTVGSQSGGAADTPAAQYENAFSLVRSGRYNAAEIGFKDFIEQNPGHALISNAKYWLGETHYVRGDFATAARVFAEGYKAYPTSTKAPDNLLKLGLSLAGLGKKDDACVALSQLKKEFTTGYQPVIRRADQEMSGLGCS